MTATGKPLYFGPKNLFGWYHPPAMRSKSLGVVIVSPNGYDLMCMQWGLRRCAETLAADGFPVVRFDLHGTGDSPGDDEQPDRVQAWLDSINDAIECLKQLSGISQVVLLGVRLGGTLASVVATSRDDVAGLVLYSPCVSGRQYVRELKAMAAAARDPEHIEQEEYAPNDVIMAGWLLTAQTVNDLGKLDISRLVYKNRRVLYIHRSDVGADQKLLHALHDAETTVRESAEIAAFAQDALFGIEPVEDFKFICCWLSGLPVVTGVTNPDNEPASIANTMTERGFVEEPVCFGPQQALFGVLCMPKANANASCIIFVSTAANHHIGTHRTTVELARKLADNGIGSFRMDIAGIGDSPVVPGRAPNKIYFLPAVDEVVAAIDVVAFRGVRNIVLTGTCSGAYLAYNAACRDPRVTVLAFVNLHRFIWRDTDRLANQLNASTESLGSYVRKALSRQTWQRLFSGQVDIAFIIPAVTAKIKRKISGKIVQLRSRLSSNKDKPNQVLIDCCKMLDRGSHIDMIYSDNDGGMDEVALYLGSRGKALSKYPGFSFHEIQGADHTFTTKKARSALFDTYVAAIRKYEQQSNHKAAVPGA